MVLKTNTGWLVPEMCSDASKLLALIGKKNVGAVFCFVYFHFFFLPATFTFLHAELDSLKIILTSYTK